ncbi:MAG: hypothetical protein MR563_04585 [Spirochaetales bacterium]|nr:hypothetical protein [Spirochaetales bacterium]
MKKTIIIALTLILVLAAFTSCENNTHEHTWDKGTVTKVANCSEKGVITYTCTGCKETRTEETPVDPQNHIWDEGETTKKATYLTTGTKKTKCTICKTESIVEIPTISLNGKVFASSRYRGPNQPASVNIYHFEESKILGFMGDVINKEVKTQFFGSFPYSIKESKLIISAGDMVVENELEEVVDSQGDVTSIILKQKGTNYDIFTPLVINSEPIPESEGHFFSVKCPIDLPYAYDNGEAMVEDKVTVDSMSIGPYNHTGNFEVTEQPGYFTYGKYKWSGCDVCGYDGDQTLLLPLVNTKWISTEPNKTSEIPTIKDHYLIIEFLEGGSGFIYAQNEKGETTKLTSINNYRVNVSSSETSIIIEAWMSPNDKKPTNFGGITTENLKDGTIDITIQAGGIGKHTFKKLD